VVVGGEETGGNDGSGVTGMLVGGGVLGRQGVNAIQDMPASHSVSWPPMQGSWQLSTASAQSFPHQYECRVSSAGIMGARVGEKLIVGFKVIGARVVVVGVNDGDSVGDVGFNVGDSDGCGVGSSDGLFVISAALQSLIPP